MEGDLREFPLSEILQFISLGSRTGVLEILRRDGVYGINFTGGTITGLTADSWTVAEELRESKMIPAEALSGILTEGVSTQDLRAALLTGGYLTAEEWTVFVARQVERLLYTLFDARDGKFRFRQSATHPGPWLPVRVSADRAVLEGTRWSETWSRAGEAIPSRHSRFRRVERPAATSRRFSPTQWRVWVALSEPGTVVQIAARTVLTEVEVVESLQYLLGQNLVTGAPSTA